MKTSKCVSKILNVPHYKIMKYYWKLENDIVTGRNVIECEVVINGRRSYLKNISDSLYAIFCVHFNKTNMIDFGCFGEVEVKPVGLYEKIVEHFENTPKEQLDKEWEEVGSDCDDCGITIGEFMEHLDNRMEELKKGNVKIVDFSDPDVIERFDEVKRLQQECLDRKKINYESLNDVVDI